MLFRGNLIRGHRGGYRAFNSFPVAVKQASKSCESTILLSFNSFPVAVRQNIPSTILPQSRTFNSFPVAVTKIEVPSKVIEEAFNSFPVAVSEKDGGGRHRRTGYFQFFPSCCSGLTNLLKQTFSITFQFFPSCIAVKVVYQPVRYYYFQFFPSCISGTAYTSSF
ncbi:MAG: hypothetical protein N3E41_08690 [Thermofilaceae archaeon]|nr:hypothetical protein [Thermofilaceae archaeon]